MTTVIININTFFPKLAAAAKLNNHASDTVRSRAPLILFIDQLVSLTTVTTVS